MRTTIKKVDNARFINKSGAYRIIRRNRSGLRRSNLSEFSEWISAVKYVNKLLIITHAERHTQLEKLNVQHHPPIAS